MIGATMSKEVFSLRIDPDLLEKTQKLHINISGVLQDALEQLLLEKKCPVCKRKFNTGTQPAEKK